MFFNKINFERDDDFVPTCNIQLVCFMVYITKPVYQWWCYDMTNCPHYCPLVHSWWRHPMEKFSALLVLCAGNSPVTGEFPTQRPVTRSFDVFFELNLNKRLSKQSWGWWFEPPSCSLWQHCNVEAILFTRGFTQLHINTMTLNRGLQYYISR